jgi:hypothetical protein
MLPIVVPIWLMRGWFAFIFNFENLNLREKKRAKVKVDLPVTLKDFEHEDTIPYSTVHGTQEDRLKSSACTGNSTILH